MFFATFVPRRSECPILPRIRPSGEVIPSIPHTDPFGLNVDDQGGVTSRIPFNPNGSVWGIEGITSPDGRILGKMGHSERLGTNVAKNIVGAKDQKIFESGVNYFL